MKLRQPGSALSQLFFQFHQLAVAQASGLFQVSLTLSLLDGDSGLFNLFLGTTKGLDGILLDLPATGQLLRLLTQVGDFLLQGLQTFLAGLVFLLF